MPKFKNNILQIIDVIKETLNPETLFWFNYRFEPSYIDNESDSLQPENIYPIHRIPDDIIDGVYKDVPAIVIEEITAILELIKDTEIAVIRLVN